MTEPVTEPDPNPYESPQAEPTPAQRVARRASLWIAVPATVVAAAVAFCCSCFPVGLLAFEISYPGDSVLMIFPWIVGAVVAFGVGAVVWRWLGKRPRSDG